jgi:phosphohistidine phosphatase
VKLLVLRHAEAEAAAASDAERRLTAKGIDQAKRVRRFIEGHGLTPDIIVASPYVRAAETAGIVARETGVEVVRSAALTPERSPAEAIGVLQEYHRFESVMIVGHEPLLGDLIGVLAGVGGTASLHVRKASLTSIAVVALRPGGGILEWSLPPKLMG